MERDEDNDEDKYDVEEEQNEERKAKAVREDGLSQDTDDSEEEEYNDQLNFEFLNKKISDLDEERVQ